MQCKPGTAMTPTWSYNAEDWGWWVIGVKLGASTLGQSRQRPGQICVLQQSWTAGLGLWHEGHETRTCRCFSRSVNLVGCHFYKISMRLYKNICSATSDFHHADWQHCKLLLHNRCNDHVTVLAAGMAFIASHVLPKSQHCQSVKSDFTVHV